MGAWSRRRLVVTGTTAVLGGCTEFVVGQPRPQLREMNQRRAESGQRAVEVTVVVENTGPTGDVRITVRALDGTEEPLERVETVREIENQASTPVSLVIEAPPATERFAALVGAA